MLGALIATGRTSQVFAVGDDRVAKVLNVGVPDHWAHTEAAFTRTVRALGVAAPAVHEVIDVDGRPAIVFSEVSGPSMWEQMLARPDDLDDLVASFVEVQRSIHRAGVPDGLPSLPERMCGKIRSVDRLTSDERDRACDAAVALPVGAALLHGDLHPGNVLMSATGPVAIDWFDAAVGHPLADVARSALLLRPTRHDDHHHLPGAGHLMLERLHARYVAAMTAEVGASDDLLEQWLAVCAASRLAEGTDPERDDLYERSTSSSPRRARALPARSRSLKRSGPSPSST